MPFGTTLVVPLSSALAAQSAVFNFRLQLLKTITFTAQDPCLIDFVICFIVGNQLKYDTQNVLVRNKHSPENMCCQTHSLVLISLIRLTNLYTSV